MDFRLLLFILGYMAGVAYLTCLLEFPVLLKYYGKEYSAEFIKQICTVVNLLTNIILNTVLVCFTMDELRIPVMLLLEILVVLAESFLFGKAFEGTFGKHLKVAFLANLKSFLVGGVMTGIFTILPEMI